MFKLSLLIFAFFAVAVSLEQRQASDARLKTWRLSTEQYVPKQFEFKQGKTYIYKYAANVLNGVPNLRDEYSSFDLTADLILQVREQGLIAMKLTNISHLEHFVDHVHTVDDEHVVRDAEFKHDLERYLTMPIEFKHEKGRVVLFKSSKNEPQWSLNMKRAILSLFNINLTPEKVIRSHEGYFETQPITYDELTYFGVYEPSITGVCETTYELNHIPTQPNSMEHLVLNVTKNRNLEKCINSDSYTVSEFVDINSCKSFCVDKQVRDINGYYPIPLKSGQYVNCPCDKQQQQPIATVDQFSTVKYNISIIENVPVVDGIRSNGRVSINSANDKITSLSTVKLSLIKIESTNDVKRIEKIEGLPTEHTSLMLTVPKESKFNDKMALNFYGKFNEHEAVKQSIVLFNKIIEQLVNRPWKSELDVNATELIIQLQENLARFNIDALRKLYNVILKKDFTEHGRESVKRQLCIDMLAIVGTNDAAKFAVELIENKNVKSYEAVRLIESIGENLMLPRLSTIEMYFKLLNNVRSYQIEKNELQTLYQTIGVNFGKMISTGCRWSEEKQTLNNEEKAREERLRALLQRNQQKEQMERNKERRLKRSLVFEQQFNTEQFKHDICKPVDVERYVQYVDEQLKQTTDFSRKVTLLQTLLSMKSPKTLPILLPYVSGKISSKLCPGFVSKKADQSECSFLRMVVISGLERMVPEFSVHIKSFLLPIYRDVSEDYHVRIEALTVLMRAELDKYELESLASFLNQETNKQVVAMSVSLFKNMARCTEPSRMTISQNAKYVLSLLPKVDEHKEYSHAKWGSLYNRHQESGMKWSSELIANNGSFLPSAWMFELARLDSNLEQQIFSIDIHQKGFDRYVYDLLQPQGVAGKILLKALNVENVRLESKWAQDVRSSFEQLKKKLGVLTRRNASPKAVIELNLFDKTRMITLDETTLKTWVSSIVNDLQKTIEKLTTSGINGQYVRVFMPKSSVFVVPNELGLPTVVRHLEPLIVSIKIRNARLHVTKVHETQIPLAFNLSAFVETSVYYNRYEALRTVIEGNQRAFGVEIPRKTNVNIPCNVTFAYSLPMKTFTMSVIPKVAPLKTNALFYHRVAPTVRFERINMFYTDVKSSEMKLITRLSKPIQSQKTWNLKDLGLGLMIDTETETVLSTSFYESKTSKRESLLACWLSKIFTPTNGYEKIEIQLIKEHSQPIGYEFTAQYDSLDGEEVGVDEDKVMRRLRNHMASVIKHGSDVHPIEQQMVKSSYNRTMEQILGTGQWVGESLNKLTQRLVNETVDKWFWTYEKQSQFTGKVVPKSYRPKTVSHELKLTSKVIGLKTMAAVRSLYVHTQDERVNWFLFEGLVKRHYSDVKSIEGKAVITFPMFTSEFNYESKEFDDLKATINAKLGWNEHKRENQQIKIDGYLERTIEKVLPTMENGEFYVDEELKMYDEQCKIDKQSGLSFSYACEKLIEKRSQFNQLKVVIKHHDLPAVLLNQTEKFDLALKAKYFKHLQYNGVDVHNEKGKLEIEAQWTNAFRHLPMMNLFVKREFEQTYYQRIVTPKVVPPSAAYPWRHVLTKRSADTCVYMNKAIRTFDNVTYSMRPNSCEYLLAMDCSPRSTFAVFVSQIKPKSKMITVTMYGQQIKIMPSKLNTIELLVNNKLEVIHEQKQHKMCLENGKCLKVYARQSINGLITVVENKVDNVEVLTDGRNVKVIVGVEYRGKICGLCGNNDNEVTLEYQAPNGCVYNELQDFINSYAVESEQCPKRTQLIGRKSCFTQPIRPRLLAKSPKKMEAESVDNDESFVNDDQQYNYRQHIVDSTTESSEENYDVDDRVDNIFERDDQVNEREESDVTTDDQVNETEQSDLATDDSVDNTEQSDVTTIENVENENIDESNVDNDEVRVETPKMRTMKRLQLKGECKVKSVNDIVRRDGKICISHSPIRKCTTQCRDQKIEKIQLKYACFEHNNRFANKIAKEIKQDQKYIENIAEMPADWTRWYKMPISCSA